MAEVADFHAPVFTAVDAIVLYFQSTVIFPSWTSRVGCRFPLNLPKPANGENSPRALTRITKSDTPRAKRPPAHESEADKG